MHILFLTDNFPPEGNAPSARTFEHAREWVKEGHKVTVITGAPNFPEGQLFKGYKNKWLLKEKIEGIVVWRVKTYITANEKFLKRSLDFVSFMFSSFLFGLFTRKVDVVIGTSPQFFTVISAWALAKLKQAPFVFELRDIWPASITAVGAMKHNWIIDLLEKIEMFLYQQADLIISVTHSFKVELIERGILANKIKVVLNGVDLKKYKPINIKNEELYGKYKLKNKFVIGYIGTHGLAHSLESVLEAAEMLINKENIRILFAGGGADRSRLEQIVIKRGLTNVIMIPRQTKDKMPQLWSLCDISLVHLKDSPLFGAVIPSKIFESMAMGLPILISAPEGEATKIIKDNKAGIIVPPEDPKRLSERICELALDKDLVRTLSDQSIIASHKFNRASLAIQMLKHVKEVIS